MGKDGANTNSRIDLDAYFERIGYLGPREPTLSVLTDLIRLHMAAIPFEAVDVLLGRGVNIAPEAVDRKILAGHRGGYCFEHASLTRRALEALGFPVEQRLARVMLYSAPEAPAPPATHASLRVKADGRWWFVDTGFGRFAPNGPLKWELDAAQTTTFGTYRLTRTHAGYLFALHYEDLWSPLYEILDFDWQPVDFKVANHYTATHPASPMMRELMIARVEARRRTTLAGNRWKRVTIDGHREERLLNADELAQSLAEDFGLPVAPDWLPLLERTAAGSPAALPASR